MSCLLITHNIIIIILLFRDLPFTGLFN